VQPAQPAPQYAAPTYAKPRQPMPKLDVTAGLLLFAAVVVAMIGSFQNAYKIVYQDGGFFYTSTNWLYQTGQSGDVQSTRVLVSGFLLAIASAVALVAGVLLVTGLGRQSATVRGFACVAAGLLFGVTTMNVLNPLDNMRLSEGQPSLRSWSLGSGFWLTVVATVVALGSLVISVLSLRKPRPAFGWNPGTAQPQYAYAQAVYAAPQAYGYQQQQWGVQPQPPQSAQYQVQPQYQAAAVPQQPRPASQPPPTIPEQPAVLPADSMPTMRTAVLQPAPAPPLADTVPTAVTTRPQTDAVPPDTTPPPTLPEPAAEQLTHVAPIQVDRLPSPAEIRADASDS
jgi:hypothetical protein